MRSIIKVPMSLEVLGPSCAHAVMSCAVHIVLPRPGLAHPLWPASWAYFRSILSLLCLLVFLYPKKVCLIRAACGAGAKELRKARANPESVIGSGVREGGRSVLAIWEEEDRAGGRTELAVGLKHWGSARSSRSAND